MLNFCGGNYFWGASLNDLEDGQTFSPTKQRADFAHFICSSSSQSSFNDATINPASPAE